MTLNFFRSDAENFLALLLVQHKGVIRLLLLAMTAVAAVVAGGHSHRKVGMKE